MGIFRLNHAVLYVRDLTETVRFYTEVLGFRPITMTPEGFQGAAFLQAPGSTNDHDLGLFEVGEAAGPAGVAGVGEVGAGVGDDVGDGVVELAVAVPRAEDGLERRLLAVAEVGETGQRRRVRLVQPLE
jgi:catechol 2,3-dioxygenase-like lactoylglutathione lyase family enzyme